MQEAVPASRNHLRTSRGDGHREPSVTHTVDVDLAMERLDYQEMIALAELFQGWAFEEPNLDGDQRTRLLQWSVDHEAIADHCGGGWRASDPGDETNALQFVARHCLTSR